MCGHCYCHWGVVDSWLWSAVVGGLLLLLLLYCRSQDEFTAGRDEQRLTRSRCEHDGLTRLLLERCVLQDDALAGGGDGGGGQQDTLVSVVAGQASEHHTAGLGAEHHRDPGHLATTPAPAQIDQLLAGASPGEAD